MPPFEYQATDAFLIVQRGICFRGIVTSGQVSVGSRVTFVRQGLAITGEVLAIEHEEQLVPETIPGTEIGLLVSGLTDPDLMQLVSPTIEMLNGPQPPLEIPMPQVVREPDS
ncbi:MAG: hypothetical protein AAF799_08075 [Myxococcota bacterium]